MNEEKKFPGASEARILMKTICFKNDREGCKFFGLHEYYIRNTTIHAIAGTRGVEKGVDVPEYLLKTMRAALKLHCRSKGNLLYLCSETPKNLDFETVIKFAKKRGFSESSLKKVGVFDKRTFKWAYRYTEIMNLLKEEDEEKERADREGSFSYRNKYPFLKNCLNHKEYLQKMGMSVFWYSFISKIPYPSLAKKGIQLPYHIKLAELMYRYLMHEGAKIDINKPYEIDFVKIFWKDKAETLYKKERLWYKLTGKHILKKQATKEELEKIESETLKQKEQLKEYDEILSFSIAELNIILKEEGITTEEIMQLAECEPKRIIWRGRVLSWSVCFARLLRECKRKAVPYT